MSIEHKGGRPRAKISEEMRAVKELWRSQIRLREIVWALNLESDAVFHTRKTPTAYETSQAREFLKAGGMEVLKHARRMRKVFELVIAKMESQKK